jgi:DNA-binding transcriptional MerR regulator
VTSAQRPGELTVDELARRARLPVRTIREYQTLRLLPAPTRRGRVGLYGAEHVERLALIARLQRRGYSLAGIKDLIEAWGAGADLPALLGVEMGAAALDERPLRLTRAQLVDRLPGLNATTLRRARTAGLVVPDGPRHFVVRSPALLALAADAVDAGVPLGNVLSLMATLRQGLGTVAESVADQILEGIGGRAGDIEPLLRRGRLLLVQGVASTFADRLGDALLGRAESAADGGALRAALERVRVDAVADAAGNVATRRRA